jgi:hypothetical protein
MSSSTITTLLGIDPTGGGYLVNADVPSQATVNVSINVFPEMTIGRTMIGLSLADSVYDWQEALPASRNTIMSRVATVPNASPGPICNSGVSSKITWQVKYAIRHANGTEITGFLPKRITQIRTCS